MLKIIILERNCVIYFNVLEITGLVFTISYVSFYVVQNVNAT